jgi:hypothetical protein
MPPISPDRPLRDLSAMRAVSAAEWLIPTTVTVSGAPGHERVEGRYPSWGRGRQRMGLPPRVAGALGEFEALRDAAPPEVAHSLIDFTTTFGQLGIDAEGNPVEHFPVYPLPPVPPSCDRRQWALAQFNKFLVDRVPLEVPGLWAEPLEPYLRYAALTRATRAFAHGARTGIAPALRDYCAMAQFVTAHRTLMQSWSPDLMAPPDRAEMALLGLDLGPLYTVEWGGGGPLCPEHRGHCRHLAAGVVNWWTQKRPVQELMVWRGPEPVHEWSGGLWGVLGAQLKLAVLQTLEPRCRFRGCNVTLISPSEAEVLRIDEGHPEWHRVRDRPSRTQYCQTHQGEAARLRKEKCVAKKRSR